MGAVFKKSQNNDFQGSSANGSKKDSSLSIFSSIASNFTTIRKEKNSSGQKIPIIEGSTGEKIVDAIKSTEDRMKIIQALNSHFIFTSLTDEDKETVAESMELYAYMVDSIIFQQGMPSKSYYILKSGLVEVIVHNRKVNRLRPGEGFGELALLNVNARSATLKCVEFSTV